MVRTDNGVSRTIFENGNPLISSGAPVASASVSKTFVIEKDEGGSVSCHCSLSTGLGDKHIDLRPAMTVCQR
jgi:hypothetical protein